MGLLDLFRPKWKHSDLNVRLDAVRDLDDTDTWTLEKVASGDSDARVRRAAIKKLRDPALLRRLGSSERDAEVRDEILGKADRLLLAAITDSDGERANLDADDALALLDSDAALIQVTRKAPKASVRRAALARITDSKSLAEAAQRGDDLELRLAALARVAELPLLVQIARESDHKQVGMAALARIQGDGALELVAEQAKVKAVRQAAEQRLSKTGTPAARGDAPLAKSGKAGKADKAGKGGAAASTKTAKRDRQRLLQVCLEVEPFCKSSNDFAAADAAIAKAREKWAEIGEVPGDQQLQERFADALAIYDERKELHRRAEALRQEEVRATAEAKKRAEAAAEREQKASEDAAAKAAAEGAERAAKLAERAAQAAAPAPALSVDEQLAALAARAERQLERAKVPSELLDELEQRWKALDPEAFAAAEPAAAQATTAEPAVNVDDGWDTPVNEPPPLPPPPVDPVDPARLALRTRFVAALGAARQKAQAGDAERAAERALRDKALGTEADRLEKLVAQGGDLKKLDAAIKQARATLKKFRPDSTDAPLRARIEAAIVALTPKIAEERDAETWRRWANLPKFEALIKEAETLAEVLDTIEDKRNAPMVLKELQQRWKAAGALPQDKSQELWGRFKAACDLAHEKGKAFFAKLDEARPENLAKKLSLCEQVEALKDSTDWKATSETIKGLQEQWKTIGPVPEEQKEAVWQRFRGACDAFYARRGEHDKSRDEERAANQAKKEALCAQAEQLSRSTDWRDTAERLKALQDEWKQVGFVPRAAADALWNRFRAACDAFFEARKATFAEKDAERAENLAKKQALLTEAESLVGGADAEAGRARVRELQAEWKNVGHVPRELADDLWDRFRAACDAVYDGPGDGDDDAAGPASAAPLEGATGVSGFKNTLDLSALAGKLAATKPDGEQT